MISTAATKLANTVAERRRMIAAGSEEISKTKLIEMLAELGYCINKDMSFKYYNTSNEIKYNAYSVNIKDKATGKSFADREIFGKPENLARHNALQEIRGNYFVFNNGFIWEL